MYIDDLLVTYEEENLVKKHLTELGLQWKPSKSSEGELIVFTGIEIDCKNKTMTVSTKTFEKMKQIVNEHLMTSEDGCRWMHFEKFQTLCGYLARLAKTCASGFVRAHSLLGRLGEAQENQFPMVRLTESDLTEIQFWTSKRHSLKMESLKLVAGSIELKNSWKTIENESSEKKVKLSDTILNSSDSSLKHWGVKLVIDGKKRSFCGTTPEHLKNEPIAVMEANAAKIAIFEQSDNSEMALAVDSTVLAACFINKRAKNQALNQILLEIFEEMARGKKIVTLYWIPTKTMAEQGADSISRQNYQEFADSFGLSEYGVEFVKQHYGKIYVDTYASIIDNPFKTSYCSTLENRNDPQNLCQNAAEFFLNNKNKIRGRLWCFPPDFLCQEALKLIAGLNWESLKGKLQILFLVREKHVAGVRFTLEKLAPLSWEIFYRRHAKNGKMKCKSQFSFVLFSIGKFR